MLEVERQARTLREKFNRKLINRIIIVKEKGSDKTWKGKISDVIDHETFSVENHSKQERPLVNVDIYDITRVV